METNQNVLDARQEYVDAINSAIDAIINLEDYTELSNPLRGALSKLNSMRHYAESKIEVGDRVYDAFNKQSGIIKEEHVLNYLLENDTMIGKKFCFAIGI